MGPLVSLRFLVTQLKVQITNLWGEPLAYITQFRDLEVTDPLMDSRTGSITLSLHDRPSSLVRPLSRMIKVAYGDALVCWGIITRPTFDFSSATVTVPFHDDSLKLKHHFLRYGDFPVDYGYPLDGRGHYLLAECAIPNENELDRGIPNLGILWGQNSSSVTEGVMPNRSQITLSRLDNTQLWRRCDRGTNIWDEMTFLTEVIEGPEFRLRPIDAEHHGSAGRAPGGFHCELQVTNHFGIGTDRRNTLTWDFGFGKNNAENVVYDPDGEQVRNHQIVVKPGGEVSREDPAHGIQHHEDSMQDYGVYMAWESGGQDDDPIALDARAQAYVQTYARPVANITVTPAMDAPGVPLYGRDFETGDRCRVRAKKGRRELDEEVRITSVTLRQQDEASNTRAEITSVPTFTATYQPPSGSGVTIT